MLAAEDRLGVQSRSAPDVHETYSERSARFQGLKRGWRGRRGLRPQLTRQPENAFQRQDNGRPAQ